MGESGRLQAMPDNSGLAPKEPMKYVIAGLHQWQEAFESLVRDGSFRAIHRQFGVLAY